MVRSIWRQSSARINVLQNQVEIDPALQKMEFIQDFFLCEVRNAKKTSLNCHTKIAWTWLITRAMLLAKDVRPQFVSRYK